MAVETPKQPEYRTVRHDAELVRMAKTIAANSDGDETVAEVIAAAARPTVAKRFKATVDKINRELGGESGGA